MLRIDLFQLMSLLYGGKILKNSGCFPHVRLRTAVRCLQATWASFQKRLFLRTIPDCNFGRKTDKRTVRYRRRMLKTLHFPNKTPFAHQITGTKVKQYGILKELLSAEHSVLVAFVAAGEAKRNEVKRSGAGKNPAPQKAEQTLWLFINEKCLLCRAERLSSGILLTHLFACLYIHRTSH